MTEYRGLDEEDDGESNENVFCFLEKVNSSIKTGPVWVSRPTN